MAAHVIRPATVAAVEALAPASVNALYRPFLLPKNELSKPDWVNSLELEDVSAQRKAYGHVKILILYGSLRSRSFSKLGAYEAARILTRIGANVRVYDPQGLPVKDESSDAHEKVTELRSLAEWSDASLWSAPELHGALSAVFKNQIDWIPLSTGSVRPTQGRVLAICQNNGGSQSFNTVNTLRLLGRWMRMFTIPNQSSLPMAWKAYDSDDRLLPSSNRDRLVDVCEELMKVTMLLRPHVRSLDDRYSEREEKRAHGRLRTQAESEAAKDAAKEAAAKEAAIVVPVAAAA